MIRRVSLRAFALGVLLFVGAGPSVQSGEATIRIDGAWARRALMLDGSGTGAVYAALVNPGRAADALLAAEGDIAKSVEVHETFQDQGMAKMRPVKKIDVPPGRTVELKPGGYHIMLIGLTRDLKPGETVQLTLVFQHAGKIPVTAQVK